MKRKVAHGMGILLLVVILMATFFPFYLMLINSFKWQSDIVKNPWFITDSIHFSNYVTAFKQIWRPLLNSLFVTLAVIAMTIVTSVLASYAFAFYKFKGKTLLYFGIIALLMIPGFVLLIPQLQVASVMGIKDSYISLIFTPAAFSVALGTFLTRTSFEAVPKSLIEAAQLEGAGDLIILGRVVVPLSKSILSTVAIMTGLSAWNNYMWPLVVSSTPETQQIAVALTKLKGNIMEGDGVMLAGYVLASIPLIILFAAASKSFIAGLTQGAVKG